MRALLLLLCVSAAGLVLAPAPAKAWWVVTRTYRRPVVVVRPVVVAPPVVVVRRFWVPAHINAFGYLVPGHWRY